MAFFRNNTVNLLNLHYGIHSIALTGGGAFFLVFLLKAGVSAAEVLLALAAILALRFIIRPIVIPLAARFGMKPLVLGGILLSALQYPLLGEVHGVGPMLFALIFVSASGDTVYWSTYHAYFATLGDDKHRGQQIGVREAIAAIVGIVSPLVAAWMLIVFGPRVAFGVTTLILFAGAVPIFFTPQVAVAREAPGAIKAALTGGLLFFSDGWVCAGYYFVWQIALFRSLDESYLAFGGALALAAVAGAIAGMFLGRLIDQGHGRRAVWLAYGGFVFVTVLRASALGNPALAVIANALGAVEACLYVPTIMTAVYNQAKRSPCTLRFHVVSEGGWDVGNTLACLLAAALIALNVPYAVTILTAIPGAAISFVVLRRYYARNPRIEVHASAIELAPAQAPLP
jgi:DHA1 family inner membrane transport protein